MTTVQPALNLWQWISEHADAFRPPVGNKVIWEDSEFIAMVVHGPNARRDFHVDPHDEILFQLRGDIYVVTVENGKQVRRDISEGQLLLLPAFVPHSPRRPADTWGLVVERKRTPDESEELLWYCERCGAELHRARMRVSDIETQLSEQIEKFDSSTDLRTCKKCGLVAPERTPEPTF